jgi:hypothetical protein
MKKDLGQIIQVPIDHGHYYKSKNCLLNENIRARHYRY